jgi:hypothetical protein
MFLISGVIGGGCASPSQRKEAIKKTQLNRELFYNVNLIRQKEKKMKKLMILAVLVCGLVFAPNAGLTQLAQIDMAATPKNNPDFFGGYMGGNIGISAPDGIDWALGNSQPRSDTITDDMVFSTNIGSHWEADDWKERMRIKKSGYVGIGTTAPNSKLHVLSNSTHTGSFESSLTQNWVGFYTVNGYIGYTGVYSDTDDIDIGTGGSNFTGSVNLVIRATPKLTVNQDGNVGIGTTSPVSPLHVENAGVDFFSPTIRSVNSGHGPAIVAAGEEFGVLASSSSGDGAGVWGLGVEEGGIGVAGTGYDFGGVFTASAGIGVKGVNSENGSFGYLGGENTGVYGETSNPGNGVIGKAFAADSNGVWGDGAGDGACGVYGSTNSPTGYAGYFFTLQGNGVKSYGQTYDFCAGGPGIDYDSCSSVRWKKNIKEIDNALNKILKLRGVYFDWDKEHGGHHDVGFIAEEVGDHIPEIVAYEKDSAYTSGMDYGRITPLLVQAIKEQQAQLKELKAEQQAQIKELKAEIAELKKLKYTKIARH